MHFSLLRLAPSHPIISGLWEAYNPFKTYSSARRPLLRFAPSHPIVSGLWETYNPFKTHCDSIYWGLLRRILLFQDSERLTTRSKDPLWFHLLRLAPSHPIVSGLWEAYNPFKRSYWPTGLSWITRLAPFCSLLPFSFPSWSRQGALGGCAWTRRARGVKSGVHYIAFWQGSPLRNASRLCTNPHFCSPSFHNPLAALEMVYKVAGDLLLPYGPVFPPG